MKRVKSGIACVVLGALAAVVVSWGFAVRGVDAGAPVRYVEYGPFTGQSGREGWLLTVEKVRVGGKMRSMPGVEPTWSLRSSGFDPRSSERPIQAVGDGWGRDYGALVAGAGGAPTGMVFEHAYGWPRPAMWFGGGLSGRGQFLAGGIELPAGWSRASAGGNLMLAKALPVRPIWGGLAINTAVYAVLFAVPVFGWPMVRTRKRLERGLCPRCGYDLAGTTGCSECGWNRAGPEAANRDPFGGPERIEPGSGRSV